MGASALVPGALAGRYLAGAGRIVGPVTGFGAGTVISAVPQTGVGAHAAPVARAMSAGRVRTPVLAKIDFR